MQICILGLTVQMIACESSCFQCSQKQQFTGLPSVCGTSTPERFYQHLHFEQFLYSRYQQRILHILLCRIANSRFQSHFVCRAIRVAVLYSDQNSTDTNGRTQAKGPNLSPVKQSKSFANISEKEAKQPYCQSEDSKYLRITLTKKRNDHTPTSN
ncbi:hypothetical protein K402DRAFT_99363 [Aulographum hederae CBS 113979]|uniref:Uncharacterized protein n=1 Tax=Aulographum hederae CBS 113979 TaxID=1176131 RepID=A0A6G1GY32_9PEZI|nr:hypothetical protein K402DRAFT_99363 [Aulographum hederae CBS 113979]